MLSRQDRRQVVRTYVIGFFIIVASMAFIYRFIYEPAKQELIELHGRLSQGTPSEYRLPQMSLESFKPWYQVLHASSEQLRERILNLIEAAHVSLKEIRFDTASKEPPFVNIPVTLKVEGDFTQLMQLFVGFANSHLIYAMQNTQLSLANQRIVAVLRFELRKLG